MKSRAQLVSWIGLILIAVFFLVIRIKVETDISLFLPRPSNPQEQFLINQFREGPGSKSLLISLQGAHSETLSSLSSALAETLSQSNTFLKVLNSDAIVDTQAQDFLFSKRYLLSPTLDSKRFSPDVLHQRLATALKRLSLSAGILEKRYLYKDPTGEFLAILDSWGQPPSLNKYKGLWFSSDGTRAFIIADILAEGLDLNQFEKAIQEIQHGFDTLKPESQITLTMVGPPAFAVASRDSIRRDATLLSIIAMSLVLSLIFMAYRSFFLVVLSAIPLLSGVILSSALVGLSFGSIHGVTLAFGIVIIGVAIDYPIHLFSHIRGGEPATQAMKRIWPTLRLGVLTTALGYISMIFSRFDGLVQLGMFSVCGLVTSAWVTRNILPQIIKDTFAVPGNPNLNFLNSLAKFFQKFKILIYLFFAGSVLFLIFRQASIWENDIAQISPIPKSQLALDRQLREELNLPNLSFWVMVMGASEQSTLRLTESVVDSLQSHKVQIQELDAVTKFLPSLKTQRRRLQAFPSIEQLKINLEMAQEDLPYKQGAFSDFILEATHLKNIVPLTYDRLKGTPLETPVQKLFFKQKDFWFSLISFKGTVDKDVVNQAIYPYSVEEVFLLEPRKISNDLINSYRDRALMFFAFGGLLIVLVLRVALGQWSNLARVLFPIMCAVLTTIVILVAFKVLLSLFHLVSLLLVVGLGLDYALFLNRSDDSPVERNQTYHGLIICNVSTIIVFLTLSFSQTPVLKAIGITVALGAFFSLFFSIIFAAKPVR